jgi:hypothetical protein
MLGGSENVVVAICSEAGDAEAAVLELGRQGIGPDSISIVAAEDESAAAPVAYYFEHGILRGTALREDRWRLMADLPGCAVLVIPDERPVLVAGSLAASVVRVLDNKPLFGDLGPIASAFYCAGIPRDTAREYELTALQGRVLVVVQGRAKDVAGARAILANRKSRRATPYSELHGEA